MMVRPFSARVSNTLSFDADFLPRMIAFTSDFQAPLLVQSDWVNGEVTSTVQVTEIKDPTSTVRPFTCHPTEFLYSFKASTPFSQHVKHNINTKTGLAQSYQPWTTPASQLSQPNLETGYGNSP